MPPPATRRGHARRASLPRHPRRISGPMRSAPAVALPPPRRRGTTGVFERIRALPEHRLIDRLLRGRVWIWLVAIMLGGIVTVQVSLLKLNAGISRDVEAASSLVRANADLETEVAKLSAGERIQQTAAEEGMVTPPAGEVGYLRARPRADARLAARRMQAPSAAATDVMANGGRAPAEIAPSTVTPSTVTPSTATPSAATALAPTAAPTVPPAPTPTPTATPVPAATAPTG
jgi:hypothetical protein